MENFYQESGRCGRDGKYAECILLYRFSDMFKISTMTFAETNGLRNAYSMVEYSISNSKKCRRDLFSNYFTEVWNDRNCGKMCDNCYYKSQNRNVVPPQMDILVHYRTLLRILDKAHSMDIKLTALKLLDAWFHKGPSKLRLEVPPPGIDRFFGEQIVAFLIINDYLREDFHYTAYSTISYIQKGPVSPQDDEIEFQPARIYDLPPVSELKDFFEATAVDQQVTPVVQSSKSPEKPKLIKRRRRFSSSSEEDSNDNLFSTSLRDSDLEKLIEKKVESKLRKILGENEAGSSRLSDAGPSRCSQESDDVVILTPQKQEIIEID